MRTKTDEQRLVQEAALTRQSDFARDIRALNIKNRAYFIMTFGCQLNENDSQKMAGQLQEMNYYRVDNVEEADFVIINTCSVRENADDRFYGNLGRMKTLKQTKPDLMVAVCGCMMKIDEHVDKIRRSFPYVDLIFGPSDIYRMPELLWRRLQGSKRVYDVGEEDLIAEGVHIVHERKHRALCTISYGCNNFCTFCIVPYTRGRERSRRAADVIAEVKTLAEQGFSEVILLGQNVNSYGLDISEEERIDFASLLSLICEQTSMRLIRFMTPHPKDISMELLDVMAKYPQIERHLHLPLQSGSDRILRKMNRRYTAAHYLNIIEEARKRIPELAISTDIIVGFPGETEEDFQATLDVVKEVAYDSAYTFQYSPRIGTPAALQAEQVPQELVTERFDRLIALQNENSLRANEARLGRTYELLIEGVSDNRVDMLSGRASDNHLINFSIPDELKSALGLEGMTDEAIGSQLEGRFARVKVIAARTFSLEGELLELID